MISSKGTYAGTDGQGQTQRPPPNVPRTPFPALAHINRVESIHVLKRSAPPPSATTENLLPNSPCLEIQGLFLLTPTGLPVPTATPPGDRTSNPLRFPNENPGDLPDGNLTSGPSRRARMTTAPSMKNSMDISVLYHLQTPLDAIKGSTAIALGGTPAPDLCPGPPALPRNRPAG